MFWWYGPWDFAPWLIFGIVMCFGMMGMFMLIGRGHLSDTGHMHADGSEQPDEPHADPALDTLRQRFASGELTPQEYEEKRKLLLTA